MKLSEYIWERIGIIVITSLIGSLYGFLVSPIIIYFFPQITVMHVVKVFIITFLAVGLFSNRFVVNSAINLIYLVAGFLGVAVGGYTNNFFITNKRGAIKFIGLGVISALLTLLIHLNSNQ